MDDNVSPDGIDTPSDDIYNIHNINFNRTPHVKSLIPRTPPGKPISYKFLSLKPRCNGPVYLPKHIYNMLNDDVKKELDKCNQEIKDQYKPTHPRMGKVHEQDLKRLTTEIVLSLTLRIIALMINIPHARFRH